jgi:hypothetical protein
VDDVAGVVLAVRVVRVVLGGLGGLACGRVPLAAISVRRGVHGQVGAGVLGEVDLEPLGQRAAVLAGGRLLAVQIELEALGDRIVEVPVVGGHGIGDRSLATRPRNGGQPTAPCGMHRLHGGDECRRAGPACRARRADGGTDGSGVSDDSSAATHLHVRR